MRGSSAGALSAERQTSQLRITLATEICHQRHGELLALLRVHLPHGAKSQIAEVLGTTEVMVSRWLHNERRAPEEFVTYALHVIKQQENKVEVVNRIRELRDIVDLESVIRLALSLHPDGRCEWEFVR